MKCVTKDLEERKEPLSQIVLIVVMEGTILLYNSPNNVYLILCVFDNILSVCMFHEVDLLLKVVPSSLRDFFLVMPCYGCGASFNVLP